MIKTSLNHSLYRSNTNKTQTSSSQKEFEFYLKKLKRNLKSANKKNFNMSTGCPKGKILRVDRLLQITYLNSSNKSQHRLGPTLNANNDLYLIRLDFAYLKRYLKIIRDDQVTCTIQQFDKLSNKAENVQMIGRKIIFRKKDDYQIITDKHGFYHIDCSAYYKSIVSTVYTLLPRSMSRLIKDNKKSVKKVLKLKSRFNDSIQNPFLNDVNYQDCGNFDEINAINQTDPNLKSLNHKKMNVLIIGLSSISFNLFKNVFPKTFGFLKSLKNNIFYENYNKIGKGAYSNMAGALLNGIFTNGNFDSNIEPEIDNYTRLDSSFHDLFPIIWKEYEKIDYLTMYNEDQFKENVFIDSKKGFRYKPSSLYTIPLSYYYKNFENKRCHNNQPMYDKELNELKNFMDQMNDNQNSNVPYFSYNFYSLYSKFYIPEGYDVKLKYILKSFNTKGFLDNTLMILMSDHGFESGDNSKYSENGQLDSNRPFFSLKMPDSFSNTSFAQNALNNKENLLTPFDVYKTLKHFYYINRFGLDSNINSEKCRENFRTSDVKFRHRRGISLFENIPTNRTCFDAHIPSIYCSDVKKKKLNQDHFAKETNYTFLKASKLIKNRLDNITASRRDVCHIFKVKKVISVVRMTTFKIQFYRFRVLFEPGDVIFESYLIFENKTLALYESIVRLSKYAKNSNCVRDLYLKEFCDCKKIV